MYSLAVLPPALVALATDDLGILVTVTGAYAGAGIQYIIPVCLGPDENNEHFVD